jgi:endonuclease YncB( thermonuclease family)
MATTANNKYSYRATLVRVIDGDTILVTVDLGFKIFTEKTLRLARINAPEKTTNEGVLAKDWLAHLIATGSQLAFESTKVDIYGRSIAEVTWDCANLSDYIVINGYAEYKKY